MTVQQADPGAAAVAARRRSGDRPGRGPAAPAGRRRPDVGARHGHLHLGRRDEAGRRLAAVQVTQLKAATQKQVAAALGTDQVTVLVVGRGVPQGRAGRAAAGACRQGPQGANQAHPGADREDPGAGRAGPGPGGDRRPARGIDRPHRPGTRPGRSRRRLAARDGQPPPVTPQLRTMPPRTLLTRPRIRAGPRARMLTPARPLMAPQAGARPPSPLPVARSCRCCRSRGAGRRAGAGAVRAARRGRRPGVHPRRPVPAGRAAARPARPGRHRAAGLRPPGLRPAAGRVLQPGHGAGAPGIPGAAARAPRRGRHRCRRPRWAGS